MGKALEILKAVRKDPNMWVRLLEGVTFKDPKEVEVTWGDDKSSKFIDIPLTRGQRWVNSQIIEKLCIDSNILMDYIEFCRENGKTPKHESILAKYIIFLSFRSMERDENGRYKPGPSAYYYLNDLVPKERKDRSVKTL